MNKNISPLTFIDKLVKKNLGTMIMKATLPNVMVGQNSGARPTS